MQRLFEFDITPIALASIDRHAQDRYKEWKNDLHEYFKDNGGIENVDQIKQKCPPTVKSALHWQTLCDRFCSEEFQVLIFNFIIFFFKFIIYSCSLNFNLTETVHHKLCKS